MSFQKIADTSFKKQFRKLVLVMIALQIIFFHVILFCFLCMFICFCCCFWGACLSKTFVQISDNVSSPFSSKTFFFCLVSSFRKKLTKASSWKFNQYNEYSKKSNQSQKLLRLAIFSWRSPKKMLDLLKDSHNSTPPGSMLCQFGKAMPSSGGQKWQSKLATNIK